MKVTCFIDDNDPDHSFTYEIGDFSAESLNDLKRCWRADKNIHETIALEFVVGKLTEYAKKDFSEWKK